MKDIEIVRLDAEVEGDKRQAAPFTTKWTCPDCGAANEIDHTDHTFSYPVFGKGQDFYLFCHTCDDAGAEGDKGLVSLCLDMTLSMTKSKERAVMLTPSEGQEAILSVGRELSRLLDMSKKEGKDLTEDIANLQSLLAKLQAVF